MSLGLLIYDLGKQLNLSIPDFHIYKLRITLRRCKDWMRRHIWNSWCSAWQVMLLLLLLLTTITITDYSNLVIILLCVLCKIVYTDVVRIMWYNGCETVYTSTYYNCWIFILMCCLGKRLCSFKPVFSFVLGDNNST